MDFDHSLEIIIPDSTENLTLGGTASTIIPVGTTAQRPASPVQGMIRFNTTLVTFEGYDGTTWDPIPGSAVDQYLRISATDTTSNFLQPKLLAGTGVSIVKSAAGNETLTINATGAVAGDQACIQVRSTATKNVTNAYSDVTWGTADVLNNAAILNWTTGTNVTVSQAGPYLISYTIPVFTLAATRTMTARVRKNAATVLNGSTGSATHSTNNYPNITSSFVAVLAAADTIQLQVISSTNGATIAAGIVFSMVRLTAATGAQGAAGTPGVPGPSGSGSTINIQDEGVTLSGSPFSLLNFTGAGVVATPGSGGTVNISIPGGTAILKSYVYYPASMDNPINASWIVNALAPMISDPSYGAFNVRQFNDTTEQGVGCYMTVPAGASNMTIKFKGRAQTAGGAARIVQLRLYTKSISDGSTVGTWSAANELTNLAIPNDALFHYYSQTISLASIGLAADTLYQFEITRRTTGLTGGTNLTGNWLLIEMSYEFT